MGALIIRIGFWGILYHSSNKEPPKMVLVFIKAPTSIPIIALIVALICPFKGTLFQLLRPLQTLYHRAA